MSSKIRYSGTGFQKYSLSTGEYMKNQPPGRIAPYGGGGPGEGRWATAFETEGWRIARAHGGAQRPQASGAGKGRCAVDMSITKFVNTMSYPVLCWNGAPYSRARRLWALAGRKKTPARTVRCAVRDDTMLTVLGHDGYDGEPTLPALSAHPLKRAVLNESPI